jgi:hypothetical protein
VVGDNEIVEKYVGKTVGKSVVGFNEGNWLNDGD